MSATFSRRPLSDSIYNPKVCGVNMKHRFERFVEAQAEDTEPWSAWVDLEECEAGEARNVIAGYNVQSLASAIGKMA
jgi:hypothetical protein